MTKKIGIGRRVELHEYLESQICQEMLALKPDVSHFDLHFGSLVAGVLGQGNMRRILVIGAHDTLIPVVLGGLRYNFVVFALATHPSYVERQLQYAVRARVRYDGRCLMRPMQSPYKAMANFGEDRFPYIVVMPDAEWDEVSWYCEKYLEDDGTLVIAQLDEFDFEGFREMWSRRLKMTDAGYCIEADGEGMEWIVRALKHE